MEELHKDKHKADQKLIVVNETGQPTNESIDRWTAHSHSGVKHLAFVIFVLTKKGEFVLHKRPERKVGNGQWDVNASHVLTGETNEDAMKRCLKEEFGMEDNMEFEHLGGFSYSEEYEGGTCENEYCLVSICKYSGEIKENPILEICKYIIFPKFEKMIIQREKKHGKTLTYKDFKKLESDFSSKKIHPLDLKNATSDYLEKLIAPIRKAWK